MLFNSYSYIVLLFLIIPLIWAIPRESKFRIPFFTVICFSLYGIWNWKFLFLLIFTTSVDYFAAGVLNNSKNKQFRKFVLIFALSINLGLLIFFKYTYFLLDNLNYFIGQFGVQTDLRENLPFDIILPLGISFYTFHSISYTIDVYRKHIKPIEHYLSFITFVTFWPQLMAGPILRAKEIVPQLENPVQAKLSDLNIGILWILSGLFKKVVLADNIAPFVDSVFAGEVYLHASANDILVGAFLFGFQIYFDFSGYSDMAVGSARLIGVKFPKNFDWPYIAYSPKEFWKRWHISLSAWIRDYLYLPLMGKKPVNDSAQGISGSVSHDRMLSRSTFSLLLTWLIMGLWHGAGWTFILWGFYHAICILCYRYIPFLKLLSKKKSIAAWSLSFLIAMIGWIPFRATSLEQATVMFTKLFNPFQYNISEKVIAGRAYILVVILIVSFIYAYKLSRLRRISPFWAKIEPIPIASAVAVVTFFVLVSLGSIEQFIYFVF